MASDLFTRHPRPWRTSKAGMNCVDILDADGNYVEDTVNFGFAESIIALVNAYDPHNDPILPMIARRLGELEANVDRINETLVAAGQMPREVCE